MANNKQAVNGRQSYKVRMTPELTAGLPVRCFVENQEWLVRVPDNCEPGDSFTFYVDDAIRKRVAKDNQHVIETAYRSERGATSKPSWLQDVSRDSARVWLLIVIVFLSFLMGFIFGVVAIYGAPITES